MLDFKPLVPTYIQHTSSMSTIPRVTHSKIHQRSLLSVSEGPDGVYVVLVVAVLIRWTQVVDLYAQSIVQIQFHHKIDIKICGPVALCVLQ